ncbi:DNA/RNA non-specific endonuclease [Maribacter sp. 2307ULW6-5]
MAVCVVGFWLFDNFYAPASYSENAGEDKNGALPKEFVPSATEAMVVHHSHYSLSYREGFEQAEWVAYVLTREHLTQDDRERPFFIEDPWVKTKSADWRNYKNSGYDRGHLVPAGDRRFSEQAYNETFYTSNISPQNRHFNAGLWNRLEMQVRRWAKRYGTLYVFTGGVLEKGLWEIGEEDVDVPRLFYKIVAKERRGKWEVVAFLMPNQEKTDALESFTVSVDEVEQRTGIDFFPGLDPAVEARLESGMNQGQWAY